jgi:hypothetical protein
MTEASGFFDAPSVPLLLPGRLHYAGPLTLSESEFFES